MKKYLQLKSIVLTLFLGSLNIAYAQTFDLDHIPWNDRTWEQRATQSSYEDKFTFKHGRIFNKDPFIWAISKEFAERFDMPKEWIDPNLKGALAVAWRTTTMGITACGYGGNPKACWPAFDCQMDIYVDSKADIPWRVDVERDFLWRGLTSMDFIPQRGPVARQSRYIHHGDLGGLGSPLGVTNLRRVDGGQHPGFNVIQFDRAFTSDIELIGLNSACPDFYNDSKAAWLGFYTEKEDDETRGSPKSFAHTIHLSEEFVRRITKAYETKDAERKKDNSAYQEAMETYVPNYKKEQTEPPTDDSPSAGEMEEGFMHKLIQLLRS